MLQMSRAPRCDAIDPELTSAGWKSRSAVASHHGIMCYIFSSEVREPANVPARRFARAIRCRVDQILEFRLVSSRIVVAPAQEEIDEPAGKLLRPRSDFRHFELPS